MSVCVTGWTSECIHIGSAFSLCVRLPATSTQQQRITGPDVCDLWSGRSCGGEASNVLNIISHRWSLKRALQRSHTHIRTPTSPFIPDHSAGFAGRMCVCEASNSDSPCADLAGAFANRIFQFRTARRFGAIWLWMRPGRQGGGWREAIHISHTQSTDLRGLMNWKKDIMES